MSSKCFRGCIPRYDDVNRVSCQLEKWLMIWGQYSLSPTLCKDILLDGGHVFWPIMLIDKINYCLSPPMPYSNFGVDSINISKDLFILLFLMLCKLAKLAKKNSSPHLTDFDQIFGAAFGHHLYSTYQVLCLWVLPACHKLIKRKQWPNLVKFRPTVFEICTCSIYIAPYRLSFTCFWREIPSPVVNLPTKFCDDRAKGVGVMDNHF